mmetsp:Transcript_29007/g.46693  ORF Transcript_29007/g.46693 Transcript_29007/m.46693 type:complete len:116 (+) Transcript_29007:88-435(+)
MLYVGKDILAQPGDRVMLSKEGSAWCQQRYPDWYSDCSGTITRVDKDGKMCDVKWDDRDRPYHYHTGCSSLHHLILISNSKTCRFPRVAFKAARSLACIRKHRSWKPRTSLLLMR